MKILLKLVIGLFIFVGLLIVISFFLPSEFSVERNKTINAPVEVVFSQVNNLHNWDKWDPWVKRDSTIVSKFEGPEEGVDSKRTWTSEQSGEGSMKIIESLTNKKIVNQLILISEWGETESRSIFEFESNDQGTILTWGMEGDFGKNPIMKYMVLMMDKWVGKDYEQGLANLKEHCENMPKPEPKSDLKVVEKQIESTLSNP